MIQINKFDHFFAGKLSFLQRWRTLNYFRVLLIGFLISCLFFLISLKNIHDYGETCDEKPNQIVGNYYVYDWKKNGVEGLERLLPPKDRYYGPFFARLGTYSQEFFWKKNKIFTEIESGHLPIIFFSSLAIFFIYIFSYQAWKNVKISVVSSLCLALFPRFIGHSQNNPKDLPLLTLYLATFIFIHRALTQKEPLWLVIASIFAGLAYSVRIDGLLVLPITILSLLFIYKLSVKRYLRLIPYLILSLVIFSLTIYAVWPYYRSEMISRFIENYQIFKKFPWNLNTLYLGKHYLGMETPWHYYLVMIGVTTPIFLLTLFVFEVFLGFKRYLFDKQVDKTKIILFFWFLIPILVHSFSGTPKYDGIRHVLMVVPALILLSVRGMFDLWRLIVRKHSSKLTTIYVSLMLIGFGNMVYKDIRMHPYQVVYFNELVGGVKGAYGKFDLDYWGVSLKEAAEWVGNNLPEGSIIKTVPPSDYFFPINKEKYQLSEIDEDYEVVLIKGMSKDYKEDYLTTRKSPIHTIRIDGGDILKIYQNNAPMNTRETLYLQSIKNLDPKSMKPGIMVVDYNSPNFQKETKVEIVDQISFSSEKSAVAQPQPFAKKMEGYLYVQTAGEYFFKMTSDDKARLLLNDQVVLKTSTGRVFQKKVFFQMPGMYKMDFYFINTFGPYLFKVWWGRDAVSYDEIPRDAIFHRGSNLPPLSW